MTATAWQGQVKDVSRAGGRVGARLKDAAVTVPAAGRMGAVEALDKHASEELKAQYLAKLDSGEWMGTMNLTEP